jgi:adenylate kinase family enzyme
MASSVAAERPMRRILVVGCPGAGKSSFARRLAEKLPLPLIYLDRFYWHSGWRPSQLSEWRDQVTALVTAPEWIMDGNYANTFDLRMPRADSLIWLNHPRMTCMRRVLMRIVKGRGRSRADLPDGCPEQFDAEFLRFIWDFPAHYRPRIVDGIENFGRHLNVIQLAGDRETEYFLQSVGTA